MTYNPMNRRYDRGSFNQPTPAHRDGFKRSPIIVDAGVKPCVTELWGYSDPLPPEWRVEGIMREGYFTLVAAHAGSGKSFLALFLALCVALGRSFFGRKTKRSRVLYVDYEMDADEQKRRLSRIASGLGVTVADERLVGHLYYHRAKYPLSTEDGVAEVKELVESYEIDFIVLDSLTFSLGGADASAAKDVMPVLQWLQGLGISGLILDHFSKSAAQGNQAFATPFGSTMKFAVARAVFNLTQADGGGLLFQATKSNFGPSPDALCYDMLFEGEVGPIVFEQLDRSDPAMAGASRHLRAHDVTLVAVEAIHSETGAPVTQQQVVDWRTEQGSGLELTLGAARNHFTALKKAGRIAPHKAGGYIPTAKASEADVPEADVPEADVPEADVPEADVPEADVPEADVPEADVPEADVPEADVPEADVPEADVPEADVPEAEASKIEESEIDSPFEAQADYLSIEDIFSEKRSPDADTEAQTVHTPSAPTSDDDAADTSDEEVDASGDSRGASRVVVPAPATTGPENLTNEMKDTAASEHGRKTVASIVEGHKEAVVNEGSAAEAGHDVHSEMDEEVQPVTSTNALPDPFLQKKNSESGSSPEDSVRHAA